MSNNPAKPVWMDRGYVLAWQAKLIATEADHGDAIDWLETLQGIINFYDSTATEDAPRNERLATVRVCGVWTAVDRAEDAYLGKRRKQRTRLEESAERIYEQIRHHDQ